MASVNKWIGIGNVGKAPEARYAPDGTCFCSISLACNEAWKDKNSGEKKEKVEWVPVSFSGKLAEIVVQYVKAGQPIYVEGKFSTRKYQGKDGQEKYTTEIRADQMQMLGGKPEGGEGNSRSQSQGSAPRAEKPKPSNPPQSSGAGFGDFDDQIPF